MAIHRPSPPSSAQVGGKGEQSDMATKAMTSVTISAVIDDPDPDHTVRLVLHLSADNFKTQRSVASSYGRQKQRRTLTLRINPDTHYEGRLWTQCRQTGNMSNAYNGVSFWTNRKPVPVPVNPEENAEYLDDQDFIFDWQFTDADQGDRQSSFEVRFRVVGSSTWTSLGPLAAKGAGENTFRNYSAKSMGSNKRYEWQVRVRDTHGLWSDWSISQSFFLRGQTSTPILLSPIGGIGRGVVVTDPVTFTWRFQDPDPTQTQTQADIRWRAVGSGGGPPPPEDGSDDDDWFMLPGSGLDAPGRSMQWSVPGSYFQPGFVYEWSIRTYDNDGNVSKWAPPQSFTATGAPGSQVVTIPLMPPLDGTITQGPLGCGTHRAFIYDRGGTIPRGEITPIAHIVWGRKRDDIANCLVTTNGFSSDCCQLLGSLRSWMHEVVVFRDNVRVFEGPITRITYSSTDVEIEAKDVMAYAYRRIMREGYNDSYRRIDLTPLTPSTPSPSTGGGPYLITGIKSVVERARDILVNALAFQDPNVLPYLTAITYSDDAQQSREVPDYSRTAWEEVDDLAATAGLDYVTVGRRIILWDVHRVIGTLPEMRDGDFSDPVIVTEYGMQTCNWFGVTNNTGIYGTAHPEGTRLDDSAQSWYQAYGPVEMLASAYGETPGAATTTAQIDRVSLEKAQNEMSDQAQRNISHRWPTPVVVRVPDGSTLNPDINLGINQLVPGVWIPLRATQTCRNVSQWQKLDEVTVEQTGSTETVNVTMSPAPRGGSDPDADTDTSTED